MSLYFEDPISGFPKFCNVSKKTIIEFITNEGVFERLVMNVIGDKLRVQTILRYHDEEGKIILDREAAMVTIALSASVRWGNFY